MLQLILGRAGSGKTTWIREKALQLARENETEVMLLVPDQLSFDTERKILMDAGPALGSKIHVYSFSHLGEELFRSYGGIVERRVDDSARALIMSLAVADCEDSLELYGKAARSNRLTGLMLETVEEMKTSGISPNQLAELSRELKGAVGAKTREIALVYAAFEAITAGVYIEPGDLLTRASRLLEGREFFKGKTLLIDGFEGFNNQKLRLLSHALRQCDNVYCSLCAEDIFSRRSGSIFAPIEETGRRLYALCKELGVKMAPPLELKSNLRAKNPEMKRLELLFGGLEGDSLTGGKHIVLHKATDPHRELEFVGASIRRLVMEGMRYGDIAIICRNSKKYASLLESVLGRYEIPVFAARPRAVDSAPLARLVLTAFSVGEYGFRTEELLQMLKTGLCGADSKEISNLENYLYMWSITGSGWKEPFTKSPLGFGTERDDKALEELEKSRRKIVFPLMHFIKSTEEGSGTELCKAVYNLLKELNCEEAVLENNRRLNAIGAVEEAQEQLRFWKELMDLLDCFALVLGERHLTRKRFAALMQEVLSQERIMDIPLRLDSVMFGTAEQIKHSAKVVFLIGASQGEFPLVPPERGIFTVEERRALLAHACPLEARGEQELLLERYYAYAAACSAGESLYISYPASDGKSDLNPSELITRTAAVFGLSVTEEPPEEYFACAREPAFSSAARAFGKNTPEAAALYSLFKEDEEFSGRISALERAVGKGSYRLANPNIARRLFAGSNFSPSQIDLYHHCKFQYFCRYGLGARERRPAQVNVLEYGSLMHYLFEIILQKSDFLTISQEEAAALVEELIKAYAAERMGGVESLSQRDQYRFRRMADTAVVLVLRLQEELKSSSFAPWKLELKLEEGGEFPPLKIPLENGESVTVGGIIDRVDIYENESGRFVRVVDYKTGRKEFKLVDVLRGLSLQMLIYLNALAEKGMLPAGALYMPSAYPTVSADRNMCEEALQKEREKKMCMSGVVLDDTAIITAMEQGAQGRFIPVGIKPNGKYTRPDYALDTAELEQLFGYVRGLISAMAQELISGNVEAKPLMVNTESCAWCPYGSVCGVQPGERKSLSMKKEDVFKIMEEGGGAYEEVD